MTFLTKHNNICVGVFVYIQRGRYSIAVMCLGFHWCTCRHFVKNALTYCFQLSMLSEASTNATICLFIYFLFSLQRTRTGVYACVYYSLQKCTQCMHFMHTNTLTATTPPSQIEISSVRRERCFGNALTVADASVRRKTWTHLFLCHTLYGQ